MYGARSTFLNFFVLIQLRSPEFKVFNEESRVIKFSGESIIGDYQKYLPEVPIIDLKWTKEGIEYFLK